MATSENAIDATYQHLLRAVMDAAMTLVKCLAAKGDQAATMELVDRAQAFAVLSLIVRRSIIIARHLATLPTPAEERAGCIADVLDVVFRFFALHKIDLATYNAAIDAELDGDMEDELERDRFDDEEEEYLPEIDVTGRRPVILAAELCRDLGMAMHGMPASWLTPLSPELRLLCARAAAAAIRPEAPTTNIGHLLER